MTNAAPEGAAPPATIPSQGSGLAKSYNTNRVTTGPLSLMDFFGLRPVLMDISSISLLLQDANLAKNLLIGLGCGLPLG